MLNSALLKKVKLHLIFLLGNWVPAKKDPADNYILFNIGRGALVVMKANFINYSNLGGHHLSCAA